MLFFFFVVLPYCSISTSLLFFDWIIIINYPILCTQVCTVIGLLNNSLMDFFLFSHSLVYNSLRHHVLQHSRLPCPSPSPGACSISCPLSQWCHPTISSSVIPSFSSCLQSIPASGSFPISQFFASGGQSIGLSASASVLLMNIQDWFTLGLTGLISLQSKGLSRIFSNTTVQNHQFFSAQLSLWSNSHIHTWLLEKTALTRQTFFGKAMSLLINILSRLVVAFLPRSNCLLISWLQPPYAVILEPKKITSLTVSIVSPSILYSYCNAKCAY